MGNAVFFKQISWLMLQTHASCILLLLGQQLKQNLYRSCTDSCHLSVYILVLNCSLFSPLFLFGTWSISKGGGERGGSECAKSNIIGLQVQRMPCFITQTRLQVPARFLVLLSPLPPATADNDPLVVDHCFSYWQHMACDHTHRSVMCYILKINMFAKGSVGV